MRNWSVLALGILILSACSGAETTAPAPPTSGAADDVRLLVERVEAVHPSPWHAVSEERFKAAARRLEARIGGLGPEQRLVELMRLTALLGDRDGHSGIFPLDDTHDRPLHLYPIRLYEFSDGFFVVDAIARPELVGARLLRIGGRPVAQVAAEVLALVPGDNDSSRRARAAQYLLVAEVLRGLGLGGDFEFDSGSVELEPVEAAAYAAAFEDLSWHPMIPQGLPHAPGPPYLAHRLDPQWVTTLAGGAAVYALYNVTLGDPADLAAEIRRRARRAERVILDLRHNPGGDNGTYPPLLDALTRLRKPLYVLIGRTTFSAAQNLLADLERARGDVVFVGEPSGGAPNQFGDPVPVALPTTGWTAHIAAVYWEKSVPDDPRLALEPDIEVRLSSGDYFAGRDPVLAAALAA